MMTNNTSAADRGYNGWSNYETWAVSLWLEQDPSLTQEIVDRVQEDDDERASEVAQQLKSRISENNPLSGNSLYSDLLNASLSEVNWQEIAEILLDE